MAQTLKKSDQQKLDVWFRKIAITFTTKEEFDNHVITYEAHKKIILETGDSKFLDQL